MRHLGRSAPRDPSTLLTGALLAGVAAFAWGSVVHQAAGPVGSGATGSQAMTPLVRWSLSEGLAYLLGWGVMMTAMMLPSAIPMIALYGSVHRDRRRDGRAALPVALFTLVYLLMWLASGLPVYLSSLAIEWAASLAPAVAATLPYGLSAILVTAGIYQFMPLKHACLHACRGPHVFLLSHWQGGGPGGALKLGVRHALYCLGCCWALMLVLVAAGAMALHWVVLVAALVFAEKLLPESLWTAYVGGIALLALGLAVAAFPELAFILRTGGP